MFWAIFLTLVIATLVFIIYELRTRLLVCRKENRRLYNSNCNLTAKIEKHRDFEIERRIKDSYNRGLYDGRETDHAYREVLKRCTDGDYDARAYSYLQNQKAGAKK